MSERKVDSAVPRPLRVLLFANTEWYLFNFRLALAKAAQEQGAEVVLVSPPGPYGERLRHAGFRWIPVPMTRRSLNPIREARLLWTLWRLYRREKPDIAHHFTIKCVVYGALAAKSAGTPAVVNAVTGMGYVFLSNEPLARILRPVVRWLLRFALSGRKSRLIVQNPDDQRAIIKARLVDAAYIRLIFGSGVDTQRYKPHSGRLDTGDGNISVVFAARLLWDKGVAELVQAARALRAEGLKTRFFAAGEPDPGNPASIPDEQLEIWRREAAVTFLGHVQDMPGLMASADIVVLPSYREGIPRSLIEAAAAGLPIVATDAPGCREVVENGVNGFLVPARDSGALAAAIRKLVLDPALAARMGAAGRQRALDVFDERIVLTNTFAAYRELVPAWQGSGPVPASYGAKLRLELPPPERKAAIDTTEQDI